MSRTSAVFSALALLLASFDPIQAKDVRLLVFTAKAVDGVDELVLENGAARIEHKEWKPIVDADVRVEAAPQLENARVVVRSKTGRPRVSVVEQPSEKNHGLVRVRIDDGDASGAAPLSFELWSVPAAEMKAAPHPFDVILITIDTLRPDHLGCYGYERATSPHLDTFARSAVRFENAFSSSCFTPPSHATLLTSRHVGDHGLLAWNALPDEQRTLAEVLADRDYRTGAAVNLTLLSDQNLGQGVEWRREGDRDAREIVDEALEFLHSDDARPFFLWLHLYDVHRPYGRAPGWTDLFTDAPRAGVGDDEDDYNLKPEKVRNRGFSPEDLRYVADRYDAGIAYADAQLAPLLAEISTPARRAKTLVVITADHGESLLEHGERLFSHDPFLYSAVTHVPLLVRYPGGTGAGTVHADLTGLIDVAPTVLSVLGIEPEPTFQGRSMRALEDGTHWPEREMYQECWGWTRQAAVRTPEWLVVQDRKTSAVRAFDLRKDASELTPLDPASDPATRALAAKLAAFAARGAPTDAPPMDPDLRRRLEALGYTDR